MKHEFILRDGLSISFMDVSMCYVSDFRINSNPADLNDFGVMIDFDPPKDGGYGCGDMTFQPHESNQKVLDKYDISEEDYYKITDVLHAYLSVGGVWAMCIIHRGE